MEMEGADDNESELRLYEEKCLSNTHFAEDVVQLRRR